ncbi:MAG: hypothetical protein K8R38_07715 [Verrucomicrobia bacterium]|nr:hypothetical protein [Verrucomicrobiota bacterium]
MATKSPKSTPASTAKPLKKAAPKASDKVKPKAIVRKQRAAGKSSTKRPPSFTLDPKPVTADPVISNDDVSLRAYFISERRQKMGWGGDSATDWADAMSQLRAEALEKPLKKR